jgi:hypothetical protein
MRVRVLHNLNNFPVFINTTNGLPLYWDYVGAVLRQTATVGRAGHAFILSVCLTHPSATSNRTMVT